MFRQAERDNVDVLCLREVKGMAAGHAALLQRGWVIHEHGNVAILISVHTAQNITSPTQVWRGTMEADDIDAMSVTLDTPDKR